MNSFLSRVRNELTAMRVIGLVLITVFMMMGADHFNIMKTIGWNRQAMEVAAWVNFGINGWAAHANYQHEFGETVFAFYASLALVFFVIMFYWHSSGDTKTKIILSLMSTFMVGSAVNFIYHRITLDNMAPTGWWGGFDGFAIQTLSPIGFILFFGYAYRLLWQATKPNSAPTPANQVEFPQTWWSVLLGTKGFKKPNNEPDGPQAMSLAS